MLINKSYGWIGLPSKKSKKSKKIIPSVSSSSYIDLGQLLKSQQYLPLSISWLRFSFFNVASDCKYSGLVAERLIDQ